MKLSEKETEDKILNLFFEQKKHNEAFTLLVNSYGKRLYYLIRRTLIDHHDTDDALQETFIKAFSSLGKFKRDSSLFSWLYRIAGNEAINSLRDKAKKKNISMEDAGRELSGLLDDDQACKVAENNEKTLQLAIMGLPRQQQEIFKLRHFEDLKFSEIAMSLSLSEGAVKSGYHVAKLKLRETLKNRIEI